VSSPGHAVTAGRRRRALGGGLLTLSALACACLVALWAAVDDAPTVQREATPSAGPAGRLRDLLQQATQSGPAPEQPRQLLLSRADLDPLINDGLHRAVQGAARLELANGHATLRASLPLRSGPLSRRDSLRGLAWFGAWLNIEARMRSTAEGQPEWQSLRIGHLPLPGLLASWLTRRVAGQFGVDEQLTLALGLVDRLSIAPDVVQLTYHWRPDTRERLRSALLPPADQLRLRACTERLTELVAPSASRPASAPVPLAELLPPLLRLADERALAQAAFSGHDELAQEHRAVLITLAMYASGQPMTHLVAAAREWPQPLPRTVTLLGRDDFPQHFLVSAVIAAEGGGRLSDLIGVYKELADTRGGSGFSFNDIAADRAGTRFGQRAVNQPRALQERITEPLKESDFMPTVDDLPEFLTLAQFHQRYGDVGAPAYRAMLAGIEARIAALPVLR